MTKAAASWKAVPEKPAEKPAASQLFWSVAGTIASGVANFEPLFKMAVPAKAATGTGTHSIEVQDSAGNILYVRQFIPDPSVVENPSGDDVEGPLAFAEWVPVQIGAALIVLKDPGNATLGQISLSGAQPVVTITDPAAGFSGVGQQTVSWTVVDPDSSVFTAKVLYSADNGVTWIDLGDESGGTSAMIDFNDLPGSNGQALIRVMVSDGANTGVATSASFTVPKKGPELVHIYSPEPNTMKLASDPVLLQGGANDPEDGVLDGASLRWSSDRQGDLGQGSQLWVTLQPGVHQITLRATDSDGNSGSTESTVTVAGERPSMALQVVELDSAPTTCVQATINATRGHNGLDLTTVDYSLDGGGTYAGVPLTALPYTFVLPGTGHVHLIARVWGAGGGQSGRS